MKIIESKLRRIIREEILQESPRKPLVETFFRFGDPRKMKGDVSVIHNPEVYAYMEEPALYSHDPDFSRNTRSEAGVSAYPVVYQSGDVITFQVGNGIGAFSRQLGGFLFDRLMNGDTWIFQARRVPSMARGTDDEPLINGSTIKNVRRVSTMNLHVTENSFGNGKRLLDLLDPWDLGSYLDMGYNEFFKTKHVSREKIMDLIDGLRSRFTTPRQLRVITDTEAIWLAGWDEDHPHVSADGHK